MRRKNNIPRIIVGLDEAGRGPVIGPLVMVALAVKEEDQKKLEWLGVKDSKLLSSQAREDLFERIHELVHDFRIEVIEPDAIDLTLQEASSNLNWLEAETSARLVSELKGNRIILDCPSPNLKAYKQYVWDRLGAELKGNRIILDCPSPNLKAYKQYVWDRLGEEAKKAELVVEHKADVNHIVVSAASVIAKVIRDRSIDHLKTELGIDFGTGYMSDPKTKEFLEKYHATYPHLFRRKWQSYKTVEEGKKQKKLGEF